MQLITSSLTPGSWVLLEKLLVKLSGLYGFRRLIIVFTILLRRPLSWAVWIRSTTPKPYFPKIHFNVIHPSRSSEWCLPLQVTHPKFCTHFWSYPCALHAQPIPPFTCISLILFGEDFKLWSSSSCRFLHPLSPSSLLGVIQLIVIVSALSMYWQLTCLHLQVSVRWIGSVTATGK
jgi:hypothetical protein